MNSSAEATARRSGAPRVGVIRGIISNDRPIVADVRTNLPTQVLDPIAIETVRRTAEDAGYADGYADGLARAEQQASEARMAYDQQFMQAMTALMGAVNQLRSREAATVHQIADQTAQLALQIAEHVLQHEVRCATDPGREAIARAMALAPEDGDIAIRMHPHDLAVLAPVDDLAPGRRISLVPDPSIEQGGALLHVDATRIDAQIPAALQRIAEVLA